MNIIFDLDGTLIDSAPDIQHAASTVLAGWGKEGLTLEETRSFIGEGAAVFVNRMMDARGINQTPENCDNVRAEFIEAYKVSVDKAVFYPAALATLEGLKAGGYALGLCTNKPEQPARAVLRHMGIESIFVGFMAGGMVERSKPAPDMLLKIIEDMGAGPALYVGDSETDAKTAERAKVPFALYTQGYRKSAVGDIYHDWAFDHFAKLQPIVEAWTGQFRD